MKLQLIDNDGKVSDSWDTNKVLWQVIAKKHIDESMSNKKWENFIDAKQDNFSEITSESADELYYNYFEQGE